jgi:hypothetical protein
VEYESAGEAYLEFSVEPDLANAPLFVPDLYTSFCFQHLVLRDFCSLA